MNTTVSSVDDPCVGVAGTSTVTCTIGSLVPGGSATITLVLTMPANPAVVTNTATVSIANTDTNPADNTSSATVIVGNLAAIPTLSPLALVLLMLALAAVALRVRA